MELNPEDVESFLTVQEVRAADTFGKTFKGHIPTNNPYGLKEMDVAIKVSHNRTPQTCDQDLETMLKNVLKLSHLRHKNIIGLVGYSTSPDHFYLVHELVPGRRLADFWKDLTWDHALNILKGLSSGISYLHTHSMGPYILCNIRAVSILVTDHCVEEGRMLLLAVALRNTIRQRKVVPQVRTMMCLLLEFSHFNLLSRGTWRLRSSILWRAKGSWKGV